MNSDSHAAEVDVPSERLVDGENAVAGVPGAELNIEFFEPPTSAIREGYLTLTWTELSQADRYALKSGSKILYQGRLPKGFVSGLENGQHELHVVAWNRTGQMVGQSDVVVVDVNHWPLSMALGLFAVGVVVMSALFVTLALGTIRTRSQRSRSVSVSVQVTDEGIT